MNKVLLGLSGGVDSAACAALLLEQGFDVTACFLMLTENSSPESEEAKNAEALGFDFAGTTLCGYTEDTKGITPPSFELLQKMVHELNIPVIAEGGIHSPEQLRQAMDQGVHACVVGGAITRPMEITKRYVNALDK